MGDIDQTTAFQSLRYGEGGWEEAGRVIKSTKCMSC